MDHLLPRFKRALARRPAPNFAHGLTASRHLGVPDYAKALRQFDAYIAALEACCLQVTALPPDPRFPDGHFVEDAVVIFRDLAFVCRSSQASRAGEWKSLLPHLDDLRIVEAPADARIDGGDVLICSDRVLVGRSERTNQAGCDALRAALQQVQPGICVQTVPFSGVLHLKSGLTELKPSLLIRDPALKTDVDLSWAQVITLPPAEGYAADAMPINETLFIAAGCPSAYQAARARHDRVRTLDMSEFRKMDGGLTCLSLRY